MARRQFTWRDIQFHAVNSQDFARGSSITLNEANVYYFITSIDGGSNSNPVTIKDGAGSVTYTIVHSDKEYFVPLRMDNGFTITAGSAVTVKFFRIVDTPDA